ncbi:DoxX family protein [Nocardiopsis alba]|uniref:DoxX family protein n=1 Tax=Nocardiopsis alba (strain ATCC BAA-2165 / BE74) TaxID=1205910 RepID=J7L4L6_NOCAA|nr:DoxX family protein [Nocardiopsis alba]AFR05719.1 doxX family protein [Nocardiopsis alba ATCC BAA-2165]
MNEPTLRNRIGDLTALLARVCVGAVFIAHGMAKTTDFAGTTAGFDAMGVPFPGFSAALAVAIEVGAGAALMIGLLLPFAGVLLAAMMGNAYYFAHVGDPLLGGFELLLVLGVVSLALGFSGGRYALDTVLPWNRRRTRETVPVS